MPWGLKRYQQSRQLHFVTFSCYRRRPLLNTPARRELLERRLEDARRSYQFFVTGYVVMPEHVHLLVSEPERSVLARAIQAIKQSVARRLALRAAEPFWQARYYDFNVWSERKIIENGSPAFPSPSGPLRFDLYSAFISGCVMTKTAPQPIFRTGHQFTLHRIAVHVVEFLDRAPKATRGTRIDRDETEDTRSKAAESSHVKAQEQLIRLGRITGCKVWVASNDRGRAYRGKPLGDGCLKELPNLGFDAETSKRVSLIDVIWIRQNSPVCAFEVETTTSVQSGLLRMSDLLAQVPALKMNLYIVAPEARQQKFIGELRRPTFQKIGLNEFCRFISTEQLDSLLKQVADLEGHVSPTVLDKVAIEVEEDTAGME